LRRKRQRRLEASNKAKASAKADTHAHADDAAAPESDPLEGQVAGLRALKNG
jgi:hypothetical protein